LNHILYEKNLLSLAIQGTRCTVECQTFVAGELVQRSFRHVDAVGVKPWRASVAAYTVLVGVAFLHAYATWILNLHSFCCLHDSSLLSQCEHY